MEMDNPDLENLYIKKLNGTLTREEAVDLEERLNTNPSDKYEFEKISTLWNSTPKLSLHKGLSSTARWNTLRGNLQRDEPSKTIPLYKTLWRYAAAAAFLIVLAGVYFYSNSSKPLSVQTKNGETKTIILPDHSTVILNTASSLRYDEATWDDERSIELDGEAFFDVKKTGIPFTVSDKNSTVKVLGTSFNVRSRNERTEVICLTGKVSFGRKENETQTVTLTQGKGATLSDHVLSDVYDAVLDHSMPWIAGDLSFHNTPLKEVFAELERHFNIPIIVKRDLKNLTFTGKFQQPLLDNVIKTVCLSAGLEYTINKNSVIIQ